MTPRWRKAVDGGGGGGSPSVCSSSARVNTWRILNTEIQRNPGESGAVNIPGRREYVRV